MKNIANLNNRRNDIDWLRNLAILLLFPFHAARVFDHWEPNYVMNAEQSWGLSWFIAITAYWFMPLLFYLAGVSSRFALNVRTDKEYVRERFYKLLIPLILGIVIIIPPQCYYALKYHQSFSGSYLDAIVIFFTDFSDLSGYFGSFTPAHLWFILYLFLISLIFIFTKKLWNYLSKHKLLKNKWMLLFLFIPLTFTEALPSPGGKNLFYYFFIFMIGYLVGTNENIVEVTKNLRFKCLMILIPYLPLWFTLSYINLGADDFAPLSIALAFIRNFALFLTFVVILGYGQKLASINNKFLRYMNEAAFPIYILHQTALIAISYYIVKLDMNIYLKFTLITLLTLLVCFLLYETIKRWSITRWMFGMKKSYIRK